jgi:hypothetical protein
MGMAGQKQQRRDRICDVKSQTALEQLWGRIPNERLQLPLQQAPELR